MAPRPLRLLLLCALAAAGEVEWEDSPALTNAWQSISSSDIDKLVDVFVQGGREVALSRSADGRGPLFWAYEFKSVEALALLMHLESDEEAEDADGKRPRDFFPDGQAELDDFTADAGAKVDELAQQLKDREEEFKAYQASAQTAYEESLDEDEEEKLPPSGIDEIDYADDEDEDDEETKDEV